MTNAEILQDFRRRYEGTYVWLSMEDQTKETLVKVARVADDANKVGVLLLDSLEYGSLTINMGSEGHALRFKNPPVGVFQHGVDAYSFVRRPAKQYRRGICADNSTMRNVSAAIVGNRCRFTAQEVLSAYKHQTYSLYEALEMLRRGKARSVALDNNYSISLSFNSSADHVVFHWNHPIARCNTGGKITTIYEDVYKSGLGRLFSNT